MLDILLVDDEPEILEPIGEALTEAGHRVTTAADGSEAMARLDERPYQLVVSDVKLPKVDGLTILRRVRRESPDTDVLLITAYGSVTDAVAAMKERAVDYLTKPFHVDEVLQVVQRIDERHLLRGERARLPDDLAGRRSDDRLVGRSLPLLRLKGEIDVIAGSDAAVLVTGESGTGKELVARMLHDRSERRSRPFIAINCGALPATLLEDELFGHERGAFTGALRKREGRFRAAHGGTLFLDEIAEMPLEAQVRLLRVLEEGTFEPVGTNATERVDVRVISATHRDLKMWVDAGTFREDLYYRIRVVELELPPLREREGDLPLLVTHFLRQLTPPDLEPPTLSPRAWAALEQYAFPGNVRELKHGLQHALVLARGGGIDLAHLPRELRGATPLPEPKHESAHALGPAVEQFETAYIESTLRLAGGERKRAAQMLGISRKSLWKKMRRYGLLDR